MRTLLAACSIGLLLTVIGCSAPTATPDAAPIPTPTPPPSPSAVIAPPPQGLILWLPDWMTQENPEAASQFQDQLDEFGNARGLQIEVVTKKSYGIGGLADFLASAHDVAPAILPDIVVLDFASALSAGEDGLLQPLASLLPTQFETDLFPSLRPIATPNEIWLDLPFVADFEHLAYQPSALSEPPLNWAIVLEASAPYGFPAGGDANASDSLIVHYLSTAEVRNLPQPERSDAGLRELFTFYESARLANVIAPITLQAATPTETWTQALQGGLPLAHTTSTLWLTAQQQATALRFGPIPTADGNPRFLVRGWSYAIVTPDPARQSLAADLIAHLLSPARLSEWSQAAHRLPASAAALGLWPANDYIFFAQDALNTGAPPPQLSQDANFMRALQRSALDVLASKADVETAVRTASESW